MIMSTTLLEPRVTQTSVTRSEWIKFRSVRLNTILLLAAGVALAVLGTLFSSFAGTGEFAGPPGSGGGDSLSTSFGAMNLSQLIIGVMAAVFVTGEYATGMIRSMFAAVADRLPVLWAKAIVAGGLTWVVMTIASLVTFFAGQAVYGGDAATYSLSDDGVLRAVLGGGVYAAAIAVMAVALGFILRSTSAAIGTLVVSLMIAPGLIGLLPDSISDTVGKVLPSNAGSAFMSVADNPDLLSPWAGFAVIGVWLVALLGAAAVVVRRRDA
jgi:ABC-2 type transport system permease protein